MASHNSVGLTNGVNGTAHIEADEHPITMEVKVIHQESGHIQATGPQPGFVDSGVQQAVHQPGFIAAPAIVDIQQPSHLPEIIHPEIHNPAAVAGPQPGFIASPQDVTGGAGFVTAPQEIAGGAGFVADSSHQPGSIAAPQEISGGVGFVADTSPQPGFVVAPQEITGGAGFVADSSHQPGFIVAPQEITGGAGFVADSTLPSSIAAPQGISGAPAFTREVKDAPAPTLEIHVVDTSATTLPGSFPGSSAYTVPQYAINALNQIAQADGFSDYVINYDRGSNHGDGFVAEIVRATIKGFQMIKGVREESELVLVVKLPPDNKARREQMGMNVFEREVMAYNEILPMFQQFQLDKGLKPGQGFISFPKCYFASYDKEKDEAVIIMEDIRKRGFKMQNKYIPVDFPHAKAVLETVAQFHGLSMAMKDQCPGVFEKFKGLKDVLAEGMVTDMMKSITVLNCQKALETLEPHEENIKQKMRAFGENIIDVVKGCTNGELAEPYSVLNHGDCWINNMMFKYQSGFPSMLCLLDWQVVRYASPVLDICYFLYLCTDSALRAQHFDNLIQGYHISLRKQVELLGSDVNQILPFTALLREMKTKAKFALSTALFIIPMLCTPNAEMPNMDELVETLAKGDISEDNEIFKMTSNTEAIYKKRMSGVIRDMHKKGYL